jgi:acyl transferase domain-containing protein
MAELSTSTQPTELTTTKPTEDIAIVGYSFRLPQDVNDDTAFWEVLQNRKNLMTEWPASRVNADSFRHNAQHKVGPPPLPCIVE